MRGDLRLYTKLRRGTPGREVGHEGTCGVILRDQYSAAAGLCKHLAVVLRDRAERNVGITGIHLYLTRNVVVYDDACRAHLLCNVSLFLKGSNATLDHDYLTLYVNAGVVARIAESLKDYELEILFFIVSEKLRYELLFLGISVGGFGEVNDLAAEGDVRSLCSLNGCDRHGTEVGGGRAYRRAVGVGCKGVASVLIGAVGRAIAVGGSNHHTDAMLADLVVNAGDDLRVGLSAEAAGGTDRHIDNVNTEVNAILKSGDDPRGARCVLYVGEYLHYSELRVRRNSDKVDILVLDMGLASRYDARNVSTVI